MISKCRAAALPVFVGALVLASMAGAQVQVARPASEFRSTPAQLPRELNPAAVDLETVPKPMPDGPFLPRVPGCQPTANCQELGPMGTPAVSNRASCTNAPGQSFITADNFQIPGSGTVHINQICWWGYYGVGTGGNANTQGSDVPHEGAECWRIRILPSSNGLPDSFHPIATLFVGDRAHADATVPGWTPSGGSNGDGTSGTLTRGTAVAPSPLGPASPEYPFTAAGLNVPVPAGACLWLEIGGANAGTNSNNRTRWSSHSAPTTSPTADNVVYQTDIRLSTGYTYGDLFSLGTPFTPATCADRAWCIGTSEGSTIGTETPACDIPGVPANSTCDTATVVTLSGTTPFVDHTNTLRATTAPAPYCGANVLTTNAVWYALTGNGTTVTVDTCGPRTNFDTVVNVYCASGGCGAGNANLNCVANNDQGPATCVGDGGPGTDPSRVSFVAASDVPYLIAVFGYSGPGASRGLVDVQIQSNNMQAANPPLCVSDRCPVDLTQVTNVETDACGAETNQRCDGPGVGTFALGETFGGTVWNTGINRDFDFWRCTSTIPDQTGAGSCWLKCDYAVEYPGDIGFYSGACTGGSSPLIGVAPADYRAFNGQCGARSVVVEADAGVDFWVNPTTAEYWGLPCSPGQNRYTLRVTVAPIGACCAPSASCQMIPQAVCLGDAGAVWSGSHACAPSDWCFGVCCTGGSCSVTSATACAASGGSTYFGGPTACTPGSCQAQGGLCCRGSTCTNAFTSATDCAMGVAPGSYAGSFFLSGAAGCNLVATINTPCCYADYNKVNSVTVQDIFDFLGDWFAGNPLANTGGDGFPGPLAVQNIFDFLTAWFSGGCF